MAQASQVNADHFPVRRSGSRGLAWRSALALVLGVAAGCGTTRVTNTQRTATEQLLISNSIDQSVSQQQYIQNATRIFAKQLYEARKPGVVLLQSPQLMRF